MCSLHAALTSWVLEHICPAQRSAELTPCCVSGRPVPQVGGLGLNLTAADTVVFLEHDWNPMKDLQVSAGRWVAS